MCFLIYKEPPDLQYALVSWYFSKLFTCFTQIYELSSFINCLKELIRLADKLKLEWKLHFLEWKICLFVQHTGNRILGLWSFRIMALCWFSQLLWSNLLATLILIENPEEVLSITNNFLYPSNSKIYEKQKKTQK